jgi:hypothetical protein
MERDLSEIEQLQNSLGIQKRIIMTDSKVL